jgi:hypothetical protein
LAAFDVSDLGKHGVYDLSWGSDEMPPLPEWVGHE